MLDWLHNCHFNSRLTYSDLCLRIPDSKFRQCLLRTLAVLFDLMCSYHEIMDFQLEKKVISGSSWAIKRISFSIYYAFSPSALCILVFTWTSSSKEKSCGLLLGQSWLLNFYYFPCIG